MNIRDAFPTLLLTLMMALTAASADGRTTIDSMEARGDTLAVTGTAPRRCHVAVAASWSSLMRRVRADRRGRWNMSVALPRPDTAASALLLRITAIDDLNFDSDTKEKILEYKTSADPKEN